MTIEGITPFLTLFFLHLHFFYSTDTCKNRDGYLNSVLFCYILFSQSNIKCSLFTITNIYIIFNSWNSFLSLLHDCFHAAWILDYFQQCWLFTAPLVKMYQFNFYMHNMLLNCVAIIASWWVHYSTFFSHPHSLSLSLSYNII